MIDKIYVHSLKSLIDLYGGSFGIGIEKLAINYRVTNVSQHKFYAGLPNASTIDSAEEENSNIIFRLWSKYY